MKRKTGKIIIKNISEYLEDLKRGSKFYDWAEERLADEIISDFEKEKIKEINLLDLGCGIAMFPQKLYEKAKKKEMKLRITIVDNIPEVLALAKEELEKKGIKDIVCLLGDATKIPLPNNSFDLVTAILFFYYLDEEEQKKVLEETYRLLTPGGKFYFCHPNRNRLVWGITYLYQFFLYILKGGVGKKFETQAIEYSYTTSELSNLIKKTCLGKSNLEVKTIWGGLWVKVYGNVNKAV